MLSIYRKEINAFFSSLIGYIAIVVFLVITGLIVWVFPDTNLLDYGFASLESLFFVAPWVYLFLIPAITMRSIAEERRTGTIELLFTRPISDFQILMAKYLAGVTLMVIAIIPTFVYYVSMHYLGNPVGIIDDGATFTSYIGLILLGAVFVSIGIFASSITNSQIVAFIVAMFLSWFFYDGLTLLGSFNLMGKFDYVVQYLGLSFHYDSIKRGVIDTSDIVYFLSVIAVFIFAALTVIKSIKK